MKKKHTTIYYLVRQIRVNFNNNQLKTNKTSYKNFKR